MRIIAGTARGRVFKAPDGWDTRPTLNRVRESLFDMLQFDIPGARVLDLFSGSGALGLEAASRGAAAVVCNDADAKCAALITQNARGVGLADAVCVLGLDFRAALETLCGRGERFDLVFLDAPYETDFAALACAILTEKHMLAPHARIAVEHAANKQLPLPPELAVVKSRRYGECAITICESEET